MLVSGSVCIYIYMYIPGSSKCVEFVPFHPQKATKNLPKGRNCTYLIQVYIYIHIYIYVGGIPPPTKSEIIICSCL